MLIYQCVHCQHVLAEINQLYCDMSDLGIKQLSESERKTMVKQRDNGDIIVQTICESCEETLSKNPEYHGLDYFIH
ncbi:anti-sigma-F factor Fin [Ornithinibacillus sp. 4-3]|uniref:Anti-sigma-F factor Fin n=1 Tax=Ornithinibacillus sp. 4-3 TaxID=3231488 RepID=A0AB39HQ77_9BACI